MYKVPNSDIWAFAFDQLRPISEDDEYAYSPDEPEKLHAEALRIARKIWNDPVETFLNPRSFHEFRQHGIPWIACRYLLAGWSEEWKAPMSAGLPLEAHTEIESERLSWAECAQDGILPIGTESILNVRVQKASDEIGKRFADLWAPFSSDLYADCVVRARFGRSTCHGFRLVEPVHEDDAPYFGWMTTGKTKFCVVGDPDEPRMQPWKDALSTWNAMHAGEHLMPGAGRPKGATYLSIKVVLDQLASERLAGRARTQLEFAESLGVTDKTVRNYLAPMGGWKKVTATISDR